MYKQIFLWSALIALSDTLAASDTKTLAAKAKQLGITPLEMFELTWRETR